VPKLFRFGADFGETIGEAAKAGSGSAARQCPAEHLQNVLRTQEGVDDAVEAGSKTRWWHLWLGSEVPGFGSSELKFALKVGQRDIQIAHGHLGISVAE